MKLLRGEKIKLRAIEPEDVNRLMEWENDTFNWEVSGTISPFSRDIIKKYVANSHLDIFQAGQLRLMIDKMEDGQTIGTLDIFDFDPFNQKAGIGVLIADTSKRNNGFASEAIELAKQYCFNHLGLQQLYCNILTDNKSSLRLFEKAGFAISGTKRKWVRSGGVFKDQYFLQLLRQE